MKVLVTGATGFLGRQLLPLLGERHEVIAVTRRPADGVETVVADLTGDVRLPPADAVVHLAQSRRYREWPEGAGDVFAVNVDATFRLLEHARTCKASHFVLASTGAVYAPSDVPLTEDAPLAPAGFYARSKLAAELLVEAYTDRLVTAVLRPFAIYGGGQEGMLVANLAVRVTAGDEVTVHGDPGLRINPIHVDDAALAFAAALELERPGVYNVAGDEAVSLTELIERLAALAGRPPRIRHTDGPSASLVGDVARMRDGLGVSPKVSLDDGLKDVLAGRAW